jgi:hypothetical protein
MIQVLIALLTLLNGGTICDWGHEATTVPDSENIIAYAGVVDSFDLFLMNGDQNSLVLFGYNEDGERELVCAREYVPEATPELNDLS